MTAIATLTELNPDKFHTQVNLLIYCIDNSALYTKSIALKV